MINFSSTNYLKCNINPEQFKKNYGDLKLPFIGDKPVTTQLPKKVAIIRAVAALAFTALATAIVGVSLLALPVIIAGSAFSGWTIYKHLATKDPLVDAFYTICGGKDKYDKLPLIDLKQEYDKELPLDALKDWKAIKHPVSRAKTLDGRNILIIKAKAPSTKAGEKDEKKVLAYVEKLGPDDVYLFSKNRSAGENLKETLRQAIMQPHKDNTNKFDGIELHKPFAHYGYFSSISIQKANEFFAQLNGKG